MDNIKIHDRKSLGSNRFQRNIPLEIFKSYFFFLCRLLPLLLHASVELCHSSFLLLLPNFDTYFITHYQRFPLFLTISLLKLSVILLRNLFSVFRSICFVIIITAGALATCQYRSRYCLYFTSEALCVYFPGPQAF